MKKLVLVGLVLALSGGFVGASVAQDKAGVPDAAAATDDQFAAASAAYKIEDFKTALRLWTPLAEQGDASAQYNLGLLYNGGQGVPLNYAVAASWWRMAADQGLAEAQYNLGVLYDEGHGVPQDYAAAASWMRMAADQGLAEAQLKIGFWYKTGERVSQDYAAAAGWYRKAAGQGYKTAQYDRVPTRGVTDRAVSTISSRAGSIRRPLLAD
jgi:TPR repeat protein